MIAVILSTDPLHTYLGLGGLSLIGEPGLSPIFPALNMSQRAYDHLANLQRQWKEGPDHWCCFQVLTLAHVSVILIYNYINCYVFIWLFVLQRHCNSLWCSENSTLVCTNNFWRMYTRYKKLLWQSWESPRWFVRVWQTEQHIMMSDITTRRSVKIVHWLHTLKYMLVWGLFQIKA